MSNILKSVSLAAIAALITTLAYHGFIGNNTGLGVALPSGTAVFETSLASPITDTATTMTLTANSVRGGGSLSGYECFTIDEGTAQAEFVCGTVSGTTVSNLERGISPADGVTEDADLQFSHRRGANVKITDFPLVQRLASQNDGSGTYENVLSYAAGVTPTGNNNLTDVEYVLSVVNGGTVSFDRLIVTGNAGATFATGTVVYKSLTDGEWYVADADIPSTYVSTLLGISQGPGTDGNAIAGGILLQGVDANQTGLSANNRYFLSSTAGAVQIATSTQPIGVSLSTTDLYFDPAFLKTYNTYSAEYAGNNTFSATTTFSAAAIFSTAISGHASTGLLVFTADGSWAKPDNLEYAEVWVCGAGGDGGTGTNENPDGAGAGGGAGGCGFEVLDADELAATTSIQVLVGTTAGEGSSFGDFLSATGGSNGSAGSANEVVLGGAGGNATGGDLNFTGETGGLGISIGVNSFAAGGQGGTSMLGAGGRGGADEAGQVGQGYGSGGGGGGGNAGAGGGHADGVVIVRSYF